MDNSNNKTIIDRFVDIAGKIASVTYLQVLKDSFMTIMPMFILAGFGTMLNSVIFPLFAEGETLASLQTIGTLINNATLNLAGLFIAAAVAYTLSRYRGFSDYLSAIIVSVGSFFAIMPIEIEATIVEIGETGLVSGAVPYNLLGSNGMFAGIIIGFAATELLIKLSDVKQFEISLGESVPPSVSKNFAVLIPVILTVSFFAVVSGLLNIFWGTNIIDIIITIVQAPLMSIGSSLGGFIIILTSGVFLFSLGIHHSVITSSILQPILLVNTNENMLAAAASEEIPHILNDSFRPIFTTVGGTGSTLGLLLAIIIFSKYEPYKQLTKLAIGPSLFNINEPIIFGMPIVFNVPLMIPFILSPIVGTLIGYFATWAGIIEPFSILVPWTTPPLLNAFLASGGDWKAPVVHLVVIVAQTLLYIPFLRIAERVAKREAAGELAGDNA
ncbi:PTS transporter subunit EIIC [Carnobacteriaceae bacterium 52-44]